MEWAKQFTSDQGVPHFGLFTTMLNVGAINVETIGLESIMTVGMVDKDNDVKFGV